MWLNPGREGSAVREAKDDWPKQVEAGTAVPVQDWLAVAADLMIEPSDAAAVRPGGFMRQARARPAAFAVPSSIKLITERASTTAHVIHEIRDQHRDAHRYWGLNE